MWKDIINYEGLYQINEEGQIKNLATNKILKNRIGKRGYCEVMLYKNKSTKQFKVHRLIAETFIPNPNDYPCVNHKDENKLNNNINNLEWCTHKYNVNYGTRTQRMVQTQRQIKKGKSVLCYDKNMNLICIYRTISEGARAVNGKPSNISKCCQDNIYRNKKYRTSRGYIWKFNIDN